MITALIAYLSGVLGGFTTLVLIAKWGKQPEASSDDPVLHEVRIRNEIGREQVAALQRISTSLDDILSIYVRNSQ